MTRFKILIASILFLCGVCNAQTITQTSPNMQCANQPALTGSVTASAGSCATTVVTNANLTGVITSSGNATSIASQTGTGTKFVVDTSPTVATPVLTTPTINGYTECADTPTISAGAVTISNTTCTFHKLSLAANTTITLPTPAAGQSFTIQVCYGGVYTVTWAGGGTLSWPAATAPTATSVSGKCDFYVFMAHDTTYTYGQSGGANFTGS
jgi:hypothetical protein